MYAGERNIETYRSPERLTVSVPQLGFDSSRKQTDLLALLRIATTENAY
jgi:hypothetical protein